MPFPLLKSDARNLMRDNSPKIIFVSIIFIFLSEIMSELQFRLPGTSSAYEQYLQRLAAGELQNIGTIYSYLRPSGVPLAFLLWLLSSVLDVGFKSYCLKITRRQNGEYKDLFDGFLVVWKILLIRILTIVLVALWSLLFIIPGIVAFYRYRQAWYILLDDPQKSALQCISESKRLMQGRKLDLFLLDLSFIGWSFLNYLILLLLPLPFSLPIVMIWLAPYYGLTCAAYYNQLTNLLAV